jgi:4-amino-4-deoxy-L-arabinose transferase-like glycosyltransferase
MNHTITRQQCLILSSLSLAACTITRLPVLPVTAFTGDEGIYLLISREILGGVLPYDGSFDHKPVGLYYLFALAQLLFGQDVYAIRLLAIFATAATAFFLAITLMFATRSGLFPAACTAIVYALTSLSMGGLETNTEILLNGYLSAALALFHWARLADQYSPLQGGLIGLLLGLMFHTNYLGGFLIIGFGVGYLVAVISKGDYSRNSVVCSKNVAILSAGFLAASFLLLAPLALWGDVSAYFGKQIALLSVYRDDRDISLIAIFLDHRPYYVLLLLYLVTSCYFFFNAIYRSSWRDQKNIFQLQIFTLQIFILIAISVSGRFYSHYSILLLPGLSLAAGAFLARVPLKWHLRGQCAAWLLAMTLFLSAASAGPRLLEGMRTYGAWISGAPTDVVSEIARDINVGAMLPVTIYIYNYWPIIYYLTETTPPTRFPFPDHHLLEDVANAQGFDPAQEMVQILATQPQYIVARDLKSERRIRPSEILEQALRREYRLVKKYTTGWRTVSLYQRKDSADTDLP